MHFWASRKFLVSALRSQVCLRRQGKHGFATRRRGDGSHGLLQGKSPCLWAESAGRKLQDIMFAIGTDALGRAAVASWHLSHHHSYAVSVRQGANRTGLTLSMPPSRADRRFYFICKMSRDRKIRDAFLGFAP